jgi:hypothetical protein
VVVSDDTAPAQAVEIPQVLSAAMAAGVYICIAQRTGGFFLGLEGAHWRDLLLGAVTLLTIGAWNAKNFIDDFKAFARSADRGFSLGPTVAFGAATFTTLGVAGTLLFDGTKPIWALAAFFLLCAGWSATSWRRRRRNDRSDPEIPKRLKRVFLYLICAVALAVGAYSGHLVWLGLAFLVVLVIFVIDAREYKTFSSSM